MKKILLILLALSMALSVCACKKNPAQTQEEEKSWLELTIATNLDADSLRLVSQEAMMAELGIRVKLVALGSDAQADLENRFAAGETFDLLLVEHVPTAKIFDWYQRGLIRTMPMADWQSMDSLYAHSASWQAVYGTQDGMLAIPQSAWDQKSGQNEMVIYCRSDWAHSLGVDDLDVVTWEKLIRLLSGFAHSDPNGDGIADTYGITWWGESFYDLLYAMMGVEDWVLEGGRVVPGYSSDLAMDAAQWALQMRREGLLDTKALARSKEEAMDLFCRGGAGMLLCDDPQALEACWKDVQDQLGENNAIGSCVKVLALPENPYGIRQMQGGEQPVMLFSAALTDEDGLRIANWMEAISKLLWLTPNLPEGDATFEQICAYRQQVFYRPFQKDAPSFTLAMTDRDMEALNAYSRVNGRNVLLSALGTSGSFEAIWGAWKQENTADGDLIAAVNRFALERNLLPTE